MIIDFSMHTDAANAEFWFSKLILSNDQDSLSYCLFEEAFEM